MRRDSPRPPKRTGLGVSQAVTPTKISGLESSNALSPAALLAKIKTVDGAGSGLDADLLDGNDSSFFLPAASFTAAAVLALLLTVDGAGSLLDADFLDGQSGAYYLDRGNHTSTQLAATISDFSEAVDDRVGVLATDTSSIDFTYNDGSNTLTADVKAGGVTDAMLVDMAQSRIKGRAASAGTGDPTDLTSTQVTAILSASRESWTNGQNFLTYVRIENTGTSIGNATDLYLGSLNGGVFLNTPTGEFGDLAEANGSVLRWSAGAVSITGTLAATGGIGSMTATTQTAGDNSTKVATTAYVRNAVSLSSYRSLIQVAASHTAGVVAGTYVINSDRAAAISGTGTLFPFQRIYIDSADYSPHDGLSPKLRLKAMLAVNDVAPTGNFTFGLYPVTRPATSGAGGIATYTLGTVVASSTVAINTPAADSDNVGNSSDFALPSNGWYVIAVVTTATVAVNSHLHFNVELQIRNA